MKRLMVLLASLVLLLFIGVVANADDGLAIWGVGDHKGVATRLGYQFDNLEVGGFAGRAANGEDVDGSYGGYGIYHIPGVIDSNDIPFLPDGLFQTVSYLGLHGGIESEDTETGFYGPLFGVVVNKFIFENTHDQIQIVTEAQYNFFDSDVEERLGKSEEFRIVAGLRIHF
jgi:hypothetical protein